MKTFLFQCFIFSILIINTLNAQEYVSPTKPAMPGKAPGMTIKLMDSSSTKKTYAIIFKHGDEVVSGLTEFAQKYNITNAYYTAIGDATSAKVGWYDYQRKMFKAIKIDTAEISSFIGDIATFNGKPVAHSHVNLATQDGMSHGGHLLELYVGPTMELFLTTTSTPLFKTLDPQFEAGVIDLSAEK